MKNKTTKTYTLYPTTLELVAQWLDNGSVLSELDYTRAQWAASEYKRLRYMDAQWEPQRFAMTVGMAETILTEIEGRLKDVDSMLSYNGSMDPDNERLLRERSRLLEDRRAILNA